MTTLTRLFPAVGRALLSLIFIAIGAAKLHGFSGFSQYMEAKHLAAVPVLLALSIAVELAGGLAVLIGWRARSSALLLLLYLVPVTAVFHDFWAQQGMAAQVELVNFLKNVAIMGGLLLIAAFGPGPYSVDSWLRRKRLAVPVAAAPPPGAERP